MFTLVLRVVHCHILAKSLSADRWTTQHAWKCRTVNMCFTVRTKQFFLSSDWPSAVSICVIEFILHCSLFCGDWQAYCVMHNLFSMPSHMGCFIWELDTTNAFSHQSHMLFFAVTVSRCLVLRNIDKYHVSVMLQVFCSHFIQLCG